MNLQYQVKPKWVSGSLKGKIGCQRIFSGVWTGLCDYLLSGSKDDISVDSCVISSDTIGHFISWTSKIPLNDILNEEVYMEQPLGFVAQRECEGLQVEEIILWFKTVSKSLIWALCRVIQEVGSCTQRKTTLCFDGYNIERESCWLCLWMILWSQEMTWRGLTT